MSSQSDVEAELARLKGGSSPTAIEGGQDGGDILRAEPARVEDTDEGRA
jgi:phage shock protein A